MLTVWRLTTARFARSAFSGEGARLYGGRWNWKGVRFVYTAASQSLAMLEMLLQDEPPRARCWQSGWTIRMFPDLNCGENCAVATRPSCASRGTDWSTRSMMMRLPYWCSFRDLVSGKEKK